jgi:hypothetical protein
MNWLKSICLALSVYCSGALELSNVLVSEISVCGNNALRRIFHFDKWESVKQLQCYCEYLDLKHIYDFYRWRFLSHISDRLPNFRQFYLSLELQNRTLLRFVFTLRLKYGANGQSFPGAVYEHFRSDVFLV